MRLNFLVRDGNPVDEALGGELCVPDLTPLLRQLDEAPVLGRCVERRVRNAVLELNEAELLTPQGLVSGEGQSFAQQTRPVEIDRELAAGLKQRIGPNRRHDLLVRDAVAFRLHALGQRLVAHEPLEHGPAELSLKILGELDGIDLRVLRLLLLQRAVEIDDRDLLAIDPSRKRRHGEIEIDTPKDECNSDEPENDPGHPTPHAFAKALQHDR